MTEIGNDKEQYEKNGQTTYLKSDTITNTAKDESDKLRTW